jgi:tetratricopeptide (TPR) repeat protein
LNDEWAQFVDSIPIDEGALKLAEYKFATGSFYRLKCAHVVAAHAMAGREFIKAKMFSKAVGEYEALVRHSPEYPYWHYELVNALYLSGEYDKALEIADGLLAHPHLTEAWEARNHLRMGDCYAKLNQLDNARYQYEIAKDIAITSSQRDTAEVRLHASNNPALLGYLLEGSEQTNEAARWYFEKAAEVAPDDFLPPYLVASSLIADHMHDDALPYIEYALTLEIPVESYLRVLHFYRGICLYRAERYTEAIYEFEEAIRLEQEHLARISRDDSVNLEVYRNWIERCEWRPEWVFVEPE